MQRGKVSVIQYRVTLSKMSSIEGSSSVHSRNFSPILYACGQRYLSVDGKRLNAPAQKCKGASAQAMADGGGTSAML
jgi:hypothetical protein